MLNRFFAFILMCSMAPMLQAITIEQLQQDIEASVTTNGDLAKQTNILRQDLVKILENKARYTEAIPYLEKLLAYYEQKFNKKRRVESIDFKITQFKEVARNLLELDEVIKRHGRLSEQANDIRVDLHEFYQLRSEQRFNLTLLVDIVAYYKNISNENNVYKYLYRMGHLQRLLGQWQSSARNFQEVLEYRIRTYGQDSLEVSQAVNYLARTYLAMNLVDRALPLAEQNLQWREINYGNAGGGLHGKIASSMTLLGEIYYKSGRLEEGEKLLREGFEALLNKQAPWSLTNALYAMKILGSLYRKSGRYSDAEQILQRAYALAFTEKGGTELFVYPIAFELSQTYIEIGRYEEAELMLKDFIEQGVASLGGNSSIVELGLLQLAEGYLIQGRAAEAEVILKKAKGVIDASESKYSYTNRLVTTYYAASLLDQNKLVQAELLLNTLNGNIESSSNTEKEWRAFFSLQKGRLNLSQGKTKKALVYLESSVDSYRKSLSKFSVNLGISLSYLAQAKAATAEYNQAVTLFQEYMSIKSAANASSSLKSSHIKKSENKKDIFIIEQYLGLIAAATRSKQKLNIDPLTESFTVSEYARSQSLQAAVLGMASRASAKNQFLAELAREEQDIRLQLDINNKDLLEVIRKLQGSNSLKINKELTSKQNDLTRQLRKVTNKLNNQFPEYNRLMNPPAASVKELQSVLKPDEVMLSYYVQDDYTYLWVVNKDKATVKLLDIGAIEITKKVAHLRKALDLPIAYLSDIPDYDTKLAYELYRTLVAPANKHLAKAKNIIVVPHGALLSLPFGALLTKPFDLKKDAVPFSEYEDAPWFAESKAISIMPSSTALLSIRKYATTNKADVPFFGFGDPYFSGGIVAQSDQVATRGIRVAQRAAINTRSIKGLPHLPETRKELQQIAATLNAGDGSLFLGKAANENNLRKVSLKDARVIAFATHGLISGDIEGLDQPALALSPPDKVTDTNDGLLDMGEVLELELNADWVILSACNTASSGDLSSDGLTGLTQAFFYAGARTLLVSLWPVESSSTQLLTTSIFDAEKKHSGIGKAEALRQARLRLIKGKGYITDGAQAFSYAHPIFWSAFIAVGENH